MAGEDRKLFGRAYSLVVAPTGSAGTLGAIERVSGLDVSDLRCVFKAKKNTKPEPNVCTVEVYNLAEESRRFLETASKLVVRLDAGYVQAGTTQIFLGEARSAYTEWDGPDCKTTITTGDSEKEMREAKLALTIGANASVDQVLSSIARALGVGQGNVAQAAARLKSKGVTLYGPGTAISGNVARELTDFCRSAGLEWSVQDGQLQILDRNKPLEDKAVLLSADTGLVGSPSIDFNASSKKEKGGLLVKAKTLIIPELQPGRKVDFAARSVRGGYRIEEVEYSGDTHGNDWYAMLTCKRY